jgi:5-deoxy-glucuronate isomerase
MTRESLHPWHHPQGTAASPFDVAISPADAGWTYSGLRVLSLEAGAIHELHSAGEEFAVVPLSGSLRIEVESRSFELAGRSSVFAKVTDWAYLPIDAEVRITATHGPSQFALCSAVATRRFDPAYLTAESVPVELRGAGPATRQVNNFMAPGVFDGADKLVCVELLTPDGNWSSYPPHRHDGIGDCVVNNEEIYYFRVGRTGTTDYSADGFAMHRTYTVDGATDINLPVRDGDVFVVPQGYHGPCIAAPGYPLYYLNVLAGPGEERTMAFCDDPAHHWVRDTWADMPTDPRCPMTTALGVRTP